MAKVFINFDESTVSIRVGVKLYADSLANLETDMGQALPATPPQVERALYNDADGRLIVANAAGDQREVQSAQWKNRFDWLIGAIDSLLAAQRARVPPPSAPPPNSVAAIIGALTSRVTALEAKVAALEAKVG